MDCPKCNKVLTPMQDRNFEYCPKKDVVVKFGEPYDRKFKITSDPNSGCGTLFSVPPLEKDWLAELERRYRPIKKNVAGHSGVSRLLQTRTQLG